MGFGTVIESKHPYDNDSDLYWDVSIPDADEGIEVRFDPQSKTEKGYDYVRFYKDATHTEYWGEEKYSGGLNGSDKNWPTFKSPRTLPRATSSSRAQVAREKSRCTTTTCGLWPAQRDAPALSTPGAGYLCEN